MISKRMLNMSCFAVEVMGLNSDRQPVYSEPIELKNVFISFSAGENDGTLGKEKADSGTLYIDCMNTKPKGFFPTTDTKIIFENHTFSISSVVPAYGLRGLEHYECSLK